VSGGWSQGTLHYFTGLKGSFKDCETGVASCYPVEVNVQVVDNAR
jgi:hypothetical protein